MCKFPVHGGNRNAQAGYYEQGGHNTGNLSVFVLDKYFTVRYIQKKLGIAQ